MPNTDPSDKLSDTFDLTSMNLLATAVADTGYGVFRNLLSSSVQEGLIGLMADKVAAEELVRAGVGAGGDMQVRGEIRSDSIFWLDADDTAPAAMAWIKGMDTLSEHFRSQLFLPLVSYEGHLARYPATGFYKAHLDRHSKTLSREISIITYLNEEWQEGDGGQLRLYTDVEKGVGGPFIDVLPNAGTVVIFRSGAFWHEVLPSKKPRLSLTGWLRGRG
ncbi:2OG-Fe(II) oxygenase [Akkermansiaceae bacterium]|nr:2OG-Fe(II) oxygenase [Akkermansiaceae bacterium]